MNDREELMVINGLGLTSAELQSMEALGLLQRADFMLPANVAAAVQELITRTLATATEDKDRGVTTVQVKLPHRVRDQLSKLGWIDRRDTEDAGVVAEGIVSVLTRALINNLMSVRAETPSDPGFITLGKITLSPSEIKGLECLGHIEPEENSDPAAITVATRKLIIGTLLEAIKDVNAGGVTIRLRLSPALQDGLGRGGWCAWKLTSDPDSVSAAVGQILEYALLNRGLSAAHVLLRN